MGKRWYWIIIVALSLFTGRTVWDIPKLGEAPELLVEPMPWDYLDKQDQFLVRKIKECRVKGYRASDRRAYQQKLREWREFERSLEYEPPDSKDEYRIPTAGDLTEEAAMEARQRDIDKNGYGEESWKANTEGGDKE